MICTWRQLAELRGRAQRPALTVFVTTKPWWAKRLVGVGAMTIVHKPGEPMPVGLLDGLHVILALEDCGQAQAVWRLMKRKEVFPAKCEAWCWCEEALTVSVGDCKTLRELDKAFAA